MKAQRFAGFVEKTLRKEEVFSLMESSTSPLILYCQREILLSHNITSAKQNSIGNNL
jgi:hypothetical protein